MSDFKHISVLLNETIENLQLQPGHVVVDGTFGGGGHTAVVLRNIGDAGKVYCFDQDQDAISFGQKRFAQDDRLIFINSNFVNLKKELLQRDVSGVDAILFDLGVSSYQIDNTERGFSWKSNCRLDMRMDQQQKLDAIQVLNNYSHGELIKIFKEYGEERYSKRIATRIIERRQEQQLEYSDQLKDIVFGAASGNHQARTTSVSRIFQAVRIEVNDELGILAKTLEDAVNLLNPGGRIAVITFHSLEDRIVKKTFQKFAKGCVCPPKFPKCVCGKESLLKIITRKPLLPVTEEIADNSRARSAKLRVGERLGASR